MPQQVTLTVKAKDLQRGDRICSLESSRWDGLVVESNQTKVKLTHVTGSDGNTISINSDYEFFVLRDVPTDEENAVSTRRQQLRCIETAIEMSSTVLADAEEKLLEDLDCHPVHYAYHLKVHISAWIERDLWLRVEKMACRIMETNYYSNPDLIEATGLVVEDVRKDLLNLQFSSRSTSTLHNGIEDCVREAQARWVRNLSFVLA